VWKSQEVREGAPEAVRVGSPSMRVKRRLYEGESGRGGGGTGDATDEEGGREGSGEEEEEEAGRVGSGCLKMVDASTWPMVVMAGGGRIMSPGTFTSGCSRESGTRTCTPRPPWETSPAASPIVMPPFSDGDAASRVSGNTPCAGGSDREMDVRYRWKPGHRKE
jgi:hypothetical protein